MPDFDLDSALAAPARPPHHRYVVTAFIRGDWEVVRHLRRRAEFRTEQEAQAFVDAYPRFGGDYSRAFRQGNWQIVEYPA